MMVIVSSFLSPMMVIIPFLLSPMMVIITSFLSLMMIDYHLPPVSHDSDILLFFVFHDDDSSLLES